MTPEEAAHHEWLNEIKHERPQIVSRSTRSPVKLKSARDDPNDNDDGKALQRQFIAKDSAAVGCGTTRKTKQILPLRVRPSFFSPAFSSPANSAIPFDYSIYTRCAKCYTMHVNNQQELSCC